MHARCSRRRSLEAWTNKFATGSWPNPLALLELPRGLTATELAGGFGLLAAHALPGRIEQSYLRRLDTLPDDTRMCCCSLPQRNRLAIRC
jgi:hypothetical protein